jgi:lipid-binding SYLF domain-containing protein
MKTKIVTFLITAAVIASAETYEQRLSDSTTVLHEMSQASDQGIPQDLLRKARCVIVVPGLKKGGVYRRRQVWPWLRVLHDQERMEPARCRENRGG